MPFFIFTKTFFTALLPFYDKSGMYIDARLRHEICDVAAGPGVMINITVTLVHGVEEVVELAFERDIRASFVLLQRQEILQVQIGYRVSLQHGVRVFVVGEELFADDRCLYLRFKSCDVEGEDISCNPIRREGDRAPRVTV